MPLEFSLMPMFLYNICHSLHSKKYFVFHIRFSFYAHLWAEVLNLTAKTRTFLKFLLLEKFFFYLVLQFNRIFVCDYGCCCCMDRNFLKDFHLELFALVGWKAYVQYIKMAETIQNAIRFSCVSHTKNAARTHTLIEVTWIRANFTAISHSAERNWTERKSCSCKHWRNCVPSFGNFYRSNEKKKRAQIFRILSLKFLLCARENW